MAETWVIDENANIVSFDYNISFISNGGSYNHLFTQDIDGGFQLNYDSVMAYGMVFPAQIITWTNEAYRTITFETAPTGNLLTWLEANGTLTPSSSPSIADKLQDLIDIKQDIKEAIENKGVDLTGVDFGGYAEKIDEIPLPKEEQTKTVSSPNFSSGNVVVTPDSGKVLTQVTVVKDNDLVPENIVKGINIFGVVGTVETVVELTQAQYDALSVYDNNTYYLIVEA